MTKVKQKKTLIRQQSSFSRKQKITIAIAFLIVALMVGSVMDLWGRGEEGESYTYNGHEFVLTDYGWMTYIGERQVILSQNPKDLENITIQPVDVESLNSVQKIYVSSKPADNVQQAFYAFNRHFSLQPRMVSACLVDYEQCADIPLKDCKDATATTGVIVLERANDTLVKMENNCLTIKGMELEKIVSKMILNSI